MRYQNINLPWYAMSNPNSLVLIKDNEPLSMAWWWKRRGGEMRKNMLLEICLGTWKQLNQNLWSYSRKKNLRVDFQSVSLNSFNQRHSLSYENEDFRLSSLSNKDTLSKLIHQNSIKSNSSIVRYPIVGTLSNTTLSKIR